jgi:fibronectin-binding autotransporter adhesin
MQDVSIADALTTAPQPNMSTAKSLGVPAQRHVIRGGRIAKRNGRVVTYAPHVVELVTSVGLFGLLPAALLLGLAGSPAAADDLYWNPGGAGTGLGGNGAWNTTQSFWNTTGNAAAGPWTTWSNTNLDNAIFSGTAGTVTLGAPITVGGIVFNTANYTIAGTGGNTLTLGGVPTISVNANGSIISAVIAGTAGFTKSGAGTLTLSANNTFTGDVNVTAGTMTLTSNAALGHASNVLYLAGGAGLSASGSLTGRTVSLTGSGRSALSGAGVGDALYTGTGGVSLSSGVTIKIDANTYAGVTQFNGVNGGVGHIYFTSVRNLGQAVHWAPRRRSPTARSHSTEATSFRTAFTIPEVVTVRIAAGSWAVRRFAGC